MGTQDVSPAAVISLLESAVTKGTQLATFASSAYGTALTQPRFSSRELGRDAVAFWGGGNIYEGAQIGFDSNSLIVGSRNTNDAAYERPN